MRNIRAVLERERPVQLAGCGIRFFLAAALTAAQLSDGSAPFALGCVAACGAGAEGLSALLGVAVGLVLFEDFSTGLAHLAVAILIAAAASAFRGLKLMKRPWFFPTCAAVLFLVVKLVYVLQSAVPVNGLLPALTAAVLTGFATWRYTPMLSSEEERLTPDALLFLGVTLLSALTGLEISGVSVGRMLMACLVLVAAWQRNAAEGAVAGLCTGLLADLCTGGGTLLFAAAYGLGGLAVGTRAGKNRIFAGVVYLCAALLPLSALNGLNAPLLAETALSGLLFLLIPSRAFGGRRLQKEEESAGTLAEGLKSRLTRTASALRDLYDSLGRGESHDTEENPAVIFDRAAEKVCRDCSLCSLCWKQEYISTFNALNDATPFLMERGKILPKDLPRHFSDRCIHLPEFLTAINGELSAFLLRGQYRKQLEETRRSARGQYAQLGELLSATAAGLDEIRPACAETRPYRIGAALKPKTGENVCGDSVCSFETNSGTLCLLLSDGCGSGEAARRESAMTSRLLRQFLEAEIVPEAALKTMNAALALRNEETGSFSTIDLLTVSLKNGEAALYKYGAAPTYIKKSGSVRRITGGTLPAGLRTAPGSPDVTRLTLETGSFTVMVSDGVADALGDDWLQNLLAGWDGSDPQVLAGLVLQGAIQQNGLADDCCVQVLYLPPEGKPQQI